MTEIMYDKILGKVRENMSASKQDKLVSGLNIKTINGKSVLGSGDLEVDGHFKGWFDTLDSLQEKHPAPTVGDYAYVHDPEPATDVSIWLCDVEGTWSNSGFDVDTSNVQTFQTGQQVNETPIDDTHLLNPKEGALPKAEDVMQLKAKLEGVPARETKVKLVTNGEGQNVYEGYIDGSTGAYHQSVYNRFIVVPLNGASAVRWLGKENDSNPSYLGWAFGTFNGEIDSTLSKFSALSKGVYANNPLNNQGVEYAEKAPDGATHAVITIWIYKSGGGSAVTMDNFYCYLQRGNSVFDMIPAVANNFNGGIDKALSAEMGKELHEEIYTPEKHVTIVPTAMKNFIQSNNTWTSDNNYRGSYIAVKPGDMFLLTTDDNHGMNALYAFLKSLREGYGTVVEYATGYTNRKAIAPNKTLTITAPSDANYLYLQRVFVQNSENNIILPTVQKIISPENRFNIINKNFEETNNNIGIIKSTIGKMSRTVPDGFRSMETVNKCQNTNYTPLHRLKATGTDQYFEEGECYKGLPYYSTQNRNDSLYNFTLETIFSMWNNPDSILYTYPDTHPGSAYTGAVCSSVVCWFTCFPLWIPTHDIVTMLDRKTINDISDVEIGDVLVCHEKIRPGDMDHAMVVCDILFNQDGITNVVVFEAWYSGTLTSRIYAFTTQGFMNLLNGTGRGSDLYIIGRLGSKIRTVQPLVVNTDIISERGDNTYYEQGEDIFVQSSQNSFTAESPSGNSTIIDFSSKPLKENTSMRNIGDVLNTEIGKWTLNGEYGEKSHLTIIKKGKAVLSANAEDNNKCTINLSGYEGCKPCAYVVIGIRNTGGSGYQSPVSNKTAGRMTAFSKANPRAWGIITPAKNETTFSIDLTAHGSVYIGYYVRIFYDTGCGQAWQDTWDGEIDSGVGYVMF